MERDKRTREMYSSCTFVSELEMREVIMALVKKQSAFLIFNIHISNLKRNTCGVSINCNNFFSHQLSPILA